MEKWKMPMQNWSATLQQLKIAFGAVYEIKTEFEK
jgi:hypothetical protein